ncbi:Ceramide synthase 1 [Lamellibrachia satsuma]|nr:Ceramide synthase 1 [Lamellibrachia satsuma]
MLTLVRYILTEKVLAPLAKWLRLERLNQVKFPESAWKVMYYGCSWSYCTYLLFSGRYDFFQKPYLMWQDWKPHMDVPSDISYAFAFEFSFYVHAIYATIYMDRWRKDSVVMIFHHILSILLLGFSYTIRYHKVSILNIFLHDIADIWLELTKLTVYMKTRNGKYYAVFDYLSTAGFIMFAVSWFVGRLYWFPLKLMHTTGHAVFNHQPPHPVPFYFFFNVMVWILFLMNIYWFMAKVVEIGSRVDPSSSCSRVDAKRSASHSFGLHQRGREWDSDDWASQDHHTHRPGLRRPGEDALVPLFRGSATREATITSYKSSSTGNVWCLLTHQNRKLFNVAHLRAKTKARRVLIREKQEIFLAHTEETLQQLMDKLSHACKEFGLTISIKKTNVMGQDVVMPPPVNINDVTLEVVDYLACLGATITGNVSLGDEINIRIAKAAAFMYKLDKRARSNNNLTENKKLHVYQACVLSTLLYSSEAWTTYARQEKTLNSFHLRCLRRILIIFWQGRVTNTEVLERGHSSSTYISWQDRITNTDVLERVHSSSTYTLLSQKRLRCLGQVHRMSNGRIPKDILYCELVTGTRSSGRPYLRCKDTHKREMKMADIYTNSWETGADDRCHWKLIVRNGIRKAEHKRSTQLADKADQRMQRSAKPAPCQSKTLPCSKCGRHRHSRFVLNLCYRILTGHMQEVDDVRETEVTERFDNTETERTEVTVGDEKEHKA